MLNRAIRCAAVILAGGSALAVVGADAAPPAPRKLLIATGWDSPTPAAFRRDLAEFEKSPFDGTAIRPTRVNAGGQTVAAYFAFSAEHWEPAEFGRMIADLQAASPHTAKANFLLLLASPGNIDWFDDSGWKEIVEHWRLLARVAREGHLKGLIYDPEPYAPPFRQFKYGAQPGYRLHTFTEYAVKARARGSEMMRAVVDEYPDITILSYRLFSDLLPTIRAQDEIGLVLEKNTYGLAPAFVNGWLDAMPPTVTLIDGNESSYAYNSAPEFKKAYIELKHDAQMLVDPSNRSKFLQSWQVGQAIYLDAYCNPPTSRWYINPLSGTETARLEANTASALRASDQYVWIYGEKGHWWPAAGNSSPWPDRLPDAAGALLRAKAEANFIPP